MSESNAQGVLGALSEKSNLIGILCVIGAVLIFSTQDMAIKWISGDYPLHEIILVRASVGLTFTLAIFVPLEGGYGILRSKRWKMHILRGFSVVIANMAFFTALATLSLAEATAIFFIAPLLITALSVPLLGEKVGLRRWLAVLTGLLGVVVMLRPGSGLFDAATLLPLGAALAYALLQILTRKLGRQEKASTMAFYIQLTFVCVSSMIGLLFSDGRFSNPDNPTIDFLFRAWVWPDMSDALIMLGVGCLSGFAGYLVSQGYRLAEAGLAAPFEYVALPLAVFWSIALFGEWPDLVAWFGIFLIAGAGLYTFYRETVKGRPNVLNRPMPRNR